MICILTLCVCTYPLYDLYFDPFKVLFLVVITLARRISEWGDETLSIHQKLCFPQGQSGASSCSSFIPKGNMLFHRVQELVFPSFCPRPHHLKEKQWHSLDVRRALWFYTKITKDFRQFKLLFVNFGDGRKDQKAR